MVPKRWTFTIIKKRKGFPSLKYKCRNVFYMRQGVSEMVSKRTAALFAVELAWEYLALGAAGPTLPMLPHYLFSFPGHFTQDNDYCNGCDKVKSDISTLTVFSTMGLLKSSCSDSMQWYLWRPHLTTRIAFM